jgi:cystathionine beta-lyase
MTAQTFSVEAELLGLRRRTNEKWRRHGDTVLPVGIAEMDFPVADEVRAAVAERLAASDFGYAFSFTRDSPAQQAAACWLADRFGWRVPSGRLLCYADVMRVMEAGIEAFSAPGDAVVTDIPAYPSFFEAAEERGRELVGVPMLCRDGQWRIDLAGLERAFRAGARVYLLCGPHNPTGTVHTAAELTRIAELARAHRVTVLCDEVHSPLVYPGGRHVPFASLPAAAGVRVLTAVSASKGWNIAGLKCAFAVPGDEEVAEALLAQPARMRDGVGILGVAASQAAFSRGRRWLAETIGHLDGNRQLVAKLLAADLPEIGYRPPDATYLAWLDCRRAADRLGGADLAARVLDRAGLAVTDGASFGAPGYLRLNFATSAPLVEESVHRLAVGLA